MTTKTIIRKFSRKINRQRIDPSLFDYSYLMLKRNAQTFREFAAMADGPVRILDAGCGFKPWREFFSDDSSYIGVDYSCDWSSPDSLASVDHLPFADDSFDFVICSEVLEHTRYPEACINELRRVCKPGGLMYLSSPFAFPEHGVPYDFQRLTQYFYRDVFKDDDIVCLRPNSSTLGTAFTTFNIFVECTPLRMVWGFRQLTYLIFNLIALVCDAIIDFAAPRLMRTLRLYTHMMPLGYNMIIRARK